MIRMTSIISNLSQTEKSLEEREQLNALHSQMLQVITRVSDMQSSLENPEVKAKQSVQNRFELNSKGEMQMIESNTNTLTSEVTTRRTADSPTGKFVVIFIDDNEANIKAANALGFNTIFLKNNDMENLKF